MKAHFILYVSDQSKSSAFYRNVLDQEPALDVDGMTGFILNDGAMIAEGAPAEILANQQVRQVYLGEGFRL